MAGFEHFQGVPMTPPVKELLEKLANFPDANICKDLFKSTTHKTSPLAKVGQLVEYCHRI